MCARCVQGVHKMCARCVKDVCPMCARCVQGVLNMCGRCFFHRQTGHHSVQYCMFDIIEPHAYNNWCYFLTYKLTLLFSSLVWSPFPKLSCRNMKLCWNLSKVVQSKTKEKLIPSVASELTWIFLFVKLINHVEGILNLTKRLSPFLILILTIGRHLERGSLNGIDWGKKAISRKNKSSLQGHNMVEDEPDQCGKLHFFCFFCGLVKTPPPQICVFSTFHKFLNFDRSP